MVLMCNNERHRSIGGRKRLKRLTPPQYQRRARENTEHRGISILPLASEAWKNVSDDCCQNHRVFILCLMFPAHRTTPLPILHRGCCSTPTKHISVLEAGRRIQGLQHVVCTNNMLPFRQKPPFPVESCLPVICSCPDVSICSYSTCN